MISRKRHDWHCQHLQVFCNRARRLYSCWFTVCVCASGIIRGFKDKCLLLQCTSGQFIIDGQSLSFSLISSPQVKLLICAYRVQLQWSHYAASPIQQYTQTHMSKQPELQSKCSLELRVFCERKIGLISLCSRIGSCWTLHQPVHPSLILLLLIGGRTRSETSSCLLICAFLRVLPSAMCRYDRCVCCL